MRGTSILSEFHGVSRCFSKPRRYQGVATASERTPAAHLKRPGSPVLSPDMKRDMDLVRKILLACEGAGANAAMTDSLVPECSIEQIEYHVDRMVQGGLIEKEPGATLDAEAEFFITLTWAGHE